MLSPFPRSEARLACRIGKAVTRCTRLMTAGGKKPIIEFAMNAPFSSALLLFM
ncbi:MAG: hypothetical protein ACR5LH_07180 [Sodalis sp. (in: enterobacteria)]